ncbi:DeoR/GlpR family DNA-binding transcription regulator [Bacillus sp. FJAT-49736]|uniref:DeoR/GlpR family DNA-binding transcription regulator n=1 Tax=Bacillus sp. FJAT-49736 TaxID=2833582 RepID=UPI001BCA5096|nr:DeoR/GlpR family DNA-binding transcription regulator [Bacillus sp. FJAT-49736]MBS4172680.1 DeoR/GlpR transcriptional regulator [Bacillus sp. FJAT-49736]
MLAEERRHKILDIIQEEGRVIAKDLADMFEISIDSIRRDLTIMEEQGLLQKTYGGAIIIDTIPKVRTLPQPESTRYGFAAPHQNSISKLAASYINMHDTVFIGGAGIQFGMLKYLPFNFPFTVITNSIKIAEAIRKRENITSYLIGGKLRADSAGSMIDTLAIEMIRKFTLDKSFLTGGGIDSKGISTATPEGAAFSRAVSEISRKNICLAPYEKVGHRMFIMSVPIEAIDLMITDQGASETAIQDIKRKQVEIIFADEKELERENNEMA